MNVSLKIDFDLLLGEEGMSAYKGKAVSWGAYSKGEKRCLLENIR